MCESCVWRFGCLTADCVAPGDHIAVCDDYFCDSEPLNDDPYWDDPYWYLGEPDDSIELTPDELAELA